MPYSGPFYFLKGSGGNVSLPSIDNSKGDVADYWSRRLGLKLTMPDGDSMAPTFIHQDPFLDPKKAYQELLNPAPRTKNSVDVACPFCDEHLSIEAPFDDAYECPYCDSEFTFDADLAADDDAHFDWYSPDRERLLESLANNTASKSYVVFERTKGYRGVTLIGNVLSTLWWLWFGIGFTIFSVLFLMMLPLTLFGDSEVPLVMSLVCSIIGLFTVIPSVKFLFEIVFNFFFPEKLERYTRTQFYDPKRKYTAWVELITSPGLDRKGSRFVLSEALLGDAHELSAYLVYYSDDSGHGGGGG